MATANAVMVWPDGKENWSGGSSVAQQCGSISHGRLRPDSFFRDMNRPTPTNAADPAEATAVNLSVPPNNRIDNPVRYQSQPSPARLAAIARRRTQRGAGHLLTLRISFRSRVAIN